MDRSCMNYMGVNNRRKLKYVVGVNEFLDFFFNGNKDDGILLRCFCLKYNLKVFYVRSVMQCYLLFNSIFRSYNPWVYYGENEE